MKNKVKNKKTIVAITIVIAVSIIGIVALTVALTYNGRGSNGITHFVERIVPIPVAIVGWHPIYKKELDRSLRATRVFYENQDFASVGVRIDFSTEDGQKKLKLWERTLLDKMIEDKVVMIIANTYGIEITDKQVHARVLQEVNRYGKGRMIEDNIKRLWGFDLNDFEEKIVRPQLYRDMLQKRVQSEQDVAIMRQKALEAINDLDEGSEFAVVVEKYSEGVSVRDAGRAGWFTHDDLLPKIADVAFEMPIGKYSKVIETDNGFHIIKVEDRRNGSESKVLLRHMIIFKPSFSQWLDEQIAGFKVKILLSEYYWNSETRHVDFADQNLRIFAEELL